MGIRVRSGLVAMSAAVAISCSCRKAFCDTFINYGGDWDTVANWSGGDVPQGTATDDLSLAGGFPSVVTSDHESRGSSMV